LQIKEDGGARMASIRACMLMHATLLCPVSVLKHMALPLIMKEASRLVMHLYAWMVVILNVALCASDLCVRVQRRSTTELDWKSVANIYIYIYIIIIFMGYRHLCGSNRLRLYQMLYTTCWLWGKAAGYYIILLNPSPMLNATALGTFAGVRLTIPWLTLQKKS
jgi:hypothetical protein